MKITIIGAGAIGGIIGAYLVKNGINVEFVDKCTEHVGKMREDGLTIELPNSVFNVAVDALTLDELLTRGSKLDIVFLCVKAQHTKEAIRSFQQLLHDQSMVVSFQNGLCEHEIAEMIGTHRTIGCFINLFADYLEPGRINYGGEGSVYIGELDGVMSSRIKMLVDHLSSWGPAKATDNIFGYLWSKIAYSAILAATALTNETIADILAPQRNQVMLLDLAAEVLKIAELQAITPVGFDEWNPAWAYPVEERNWQLIEQEMGNHIKRLRTYTKTRTGIWRDLAVHKRKTEVSAHLMPVIQIAESKGTDVVLTKAVLDMIREIEDGKRQLSCDNIEELHQIHQKNI